MEALPTPKKGLNTAPPSFSATPMQPEAASTFGGEKVAQPPAPKQPEAPVARTPVVMVSFRRRHSGANGRNHHKVPYTKLDTRRAADGVNHRGAALQLGGELRVAGDDDMGLRTLSFTYTLPVAVREPNGCPLVLCVCSGETEAASTEVVSKEPWRVSSEITPKEMAGASLRSRYQHDAGCVTTPSSLIIRVRSPGFSTSPATSSGAIVGGL